MIVPCWLFSLPLCVEFELSSQEQCQALEHDGGRMSKSMQDSRLHAKPLNPRIPLHRLVFVWSSAVAVANAVKWLTVFPQARIDGR